MKQTFYTRFFFLYKHINYINSPTVLFLSVNPFISITSSLSFLDTSSLLPISSIIFLFINLMSTKVDKTNSTQCFHCKSSSMRNYTENITWDLLTVIFKKPRVTVPNCLDFNNLHNVSWVCTVFTLAKFHFKRCSLFSFKI